MEATCEDTYVAEFVASGGLVGLASPSWAGYTSDPFQSDDSNSYWEFDDEIPDGDVWACFHPTPEGQCALYRLSRATALRKVSNERVGVYAFGDSSQLLAEANSFKATPFIASRPSALAG